MASKSRSFRVLIAMKPLVYKDEAVKLTREMVLEALLDKLSRKEIDDNFVVVIEELGAA